LAIEKGEKKLNEKRLLSMKEKEAKEQMLAKITNNLNEKQLLIKNLVSTTIEKVQNKIDSKEENQIIHNFSKRHVFYIKSLYLFH
jgi:hypothetical protein